MKEPCATNENSGQSSTNESAQSAESDVTTPAPSSDVSADITPPKSDDFNEGIRKIVEEGRVTRGQAKLAHLQDVLMDKLNHCGLALHKVTTLKADRGVKDFDLVADAAMTHRQLEQEALKAVNEYVDEVARQQATREQESGQ